MDPFSTVPDCVRAFGFAEQNFAALGERIAALEAAQPAITPEQVVGVINDELESYRTRVNAGVLAALSKVGFQPRDPGEQEEG